MKKNLRRNKKYTTRTNLMSAQYGITLVALVVTIILMLILAGIVINLVIGENAIIKRVMKAGEEYKQAEVNEKKDLDKLYASILVAGDSKVTLNMEELEEYINSKVEEKLANNSTTAQSTGINTNAYICNNRNVTSTYSNVTTMTGFTKTSDENNNISQYLSYCDEDGYTVLKSGWYFIDMDVQAGSPGDCVELELYLCVNGTKVARARMGSRGMHWNYGQNSFSLFLKEGDKIYFIASQNGVNSRGSNVSGRCYPMF